MITGTYFYATINTPAKSKKMVGAGSQTSTAALHVQEQAQAGGRPNREPRHVRSRKRRDKDRESFPDRAGRGVVSVLSEQPSGIDHQHAARRHVTGCDGDNQQAECHRQEDERVPRRDFDQQTANKAAGRIDAGDCDQHADDDEQCAFAERKPEQSLMTRPERQADQRVRPDDARLLQRSSRTGPWRRGATHRVRSRQSTPYSALLAQRVSDNLVHRLH